MSESILCLMQNQCFALTWLVTSCHKDDVQLFNMEATGSRCNVHRLDWFTAAIKWTTQRCRDNLNMSSVNLNNLWIANETGFRSGFKGPCCFLTGSSLCWWETLLSWEPPVLRRQSLLHQTRWNSSSHTNMYSASLNSVVKPVCRTELSHVADKVQSHLCWLVAEVSWVTNRLKDSRKICATVIVQFKVCKVTVEYFIMWSCCCWCRPCDCSPVQRWSVRVSRSNHLLWKPRRKVGMLPDAEGTEWSSRSFTAVQDIG